MKTEDRGLADKLATIKLAELFAEWAPVARPAATEVHLSDLPPYRPDEAAKIREAVKAGYNLHSKNLAARRHRMAGASQEEYAEYKAQNANEVTKRAQKLATMNLAMWEPVADRLIELRRWDLEKDSDDYIEFVRLIAEAYMDASRSGLELDDGRPALEPTAPVVIAGRKLHSETAASGENMIELFELYANQRVKEGLKRRDGVSQDRMVVGLFSSFVGPHRSVNSITTAEARDFRNTLGTLPPRFAKRKQFVGMNLRQIAKMSREKDEKTLSAVTQARYISTLSPYFAWLKSEGYADQQPFDGLHQRILKGRNPRPPFSTDQLNRILNSPLYVGHKKEGKEHLPGDLKSDDWKHWFPLICMLTGARSGEVAQLRINDLKLEFGIWMISITEDDSTNQRTKNRKSRVVAVHQKLIEIGFLNFHEKQVARAQIDHCPLLFPELVVGNDEQFGARPARWFRDYLADIGIKNSGDGLGAHSFRHGMTDELRKADYTNEEIGAKVLGHSNKSVTAGYGVTREGTANKLKEIIDAAKFEGVDFTGVTI